jgi:hypothetical protein
MGDKTIPKPLISSDNLQKPEHEWNVQLQLTRDLRPMLICFSAAVQFNLTDCAAAYSFRNTFLRGQKGNEVATKLYFPHSFVFIFIFCFGIPNSNSFLQSAVLS